MAEGENTSKIEALRFLDTLASVGVETVDITRTNLQEEILSFRPNVRVSVLRRLLPAELARNTQLQHNFIVRPRSKNIDFIQLDDLSPSMLERVRPVALFTLQTSPKGSQAWIALDAPHDRDYTRRVRKATGADLMASGAARIAGSLNFKEKYAPDFPRVQLTHTRPGLIVTKSRLETLRLVARPEVFPAGSFRASLTRTGVRKWPSYQRCIDGAPLNHEGTGPDRSRADFVWSKIALEWGWSTEETIAKLREESPKARVREERYAVKTVQEAAAAIERNSGRLMK
jgi:hypothetical protein